jgi:hypothetical protein
MAFPIMNAQSITKTIAHLSVATTTGHGKMLDTGPINVMSVPGVIDVSGMEFSIGLWRDSISGSVTLMAQTGGSQVKVTLSDGGATGDAKSILATELSNTAAFAASVPKDTTGTSTTDLDADDWVNFHVTAQPTTVSGMSAAHLALSYLYGKPAAIN